MFDGILKYLSELILNQKTLHAAEEFFSKYPLYTSYFNLTVAR
jgi:hypothetical protein